MKPFHKKPSLKECVVYVVLAMQRLLFFPIIMGDYLSFKKKSRKVPLRFLIKFRDIYPFIFDKTTVTNFDRHYVYHTAWAARKVRQISPEFHVDISSDLYFSSIVSAFIPVRFYDYRPAKLNLSNLLSSEADLLKLPFDNGAFHSLSCLHVVEHIGLGRYGDSIDPDGDIKAMAELKRVLAPGGSLLFVVPTGSSRIKFNAHRIYSYKQTLEQFKDLELKEFYFIPDEGDPMVNPAPKIIEAQKYGCGCFWFVKRT